MTDSAPRPTKPRHSALFVGWGVLLCLLGWPILAAAGFMSARLWGTEEQSGGAVPLALLGWGCVIVGAILAAVGAYRLAQHADRAAGVRFVETAEGSLKVYDPNPRER